MRAGGGEGRAAAGWLMDIVVQYYRKARRRRAVLLILAGELSCARCRLAAVREAAGARGEVRKTKKMHKCCRKRA